MIKQIKLICILLILPLLVFADGNKALFEAANELYSEARYVDAIEAYERILQTGQESSEVYYNLANSYFKNNQLSLSILNYERGLLLAPGDEDILYNLSIANELIVDEIDDIPEFFLITWYKNARNMLSSNSWSVVSLISFLIICLMVVGFVVTRRRGSKQILFPAIILVLIISALSLTMSIQQSKRITDRNTCIVFMQTVTVKSSPDESGTDLFVIHEGLKVEISDKLSDWFEIRLPDGNVGWIPSAAVEVI